MDIRDGFIGTVGNTPLIKLRRASEMTGCTILGKAEFLNPGGSVKDRAALFIIKDAEERGLLRPGGVIVEGTAGNTGIGLSLVGNARGYRTVIVMPETQSHEKKDMLTLCGADLLLVPARRLFDPRLFTRSSGMVAHGIAGHGPGAVRACDGGGSDPGRPERHELGRGDGAAVRRWAGQVDRGARRRFRHRLSVEFVQTWVAKRTQSADPEVA